ncbi:MAG: hypothetical protein U1E11_05075 [Dethiobacteria bacterium]|nr:hypothetical protein [Dethiobacteria bacterium]
MKSNKDFIALSEFDLHIHRFGKITGLAAFLLMLAFPLTASILFGIIPDFKLIWKPMLYISVVMAIFSITELIAYPPILGSGSVYMSYVTGNVSNLKMPCAISSLKAAGIEQGTPEGNVISMIAVGVSTLVSMVLIIIGIILIAPLTPLLTSATLKPAFDNIMPALYGGLAGTWMIFYWKQAVTPLVLGIIGVLLLGLTASYILPFSFILSIAASRILYKRNILR